MSKIQEMKHLSTTYAKFYKSASSKGQGEKGQTGDMRKEFI